MTSSMAGQDFTSWEATFALTSMKRRATYFCNAFRINCTKSLAIPRSSDTTLEIGLGD